MPDSREPLVHRPPPSFSKAPPKPSPSARPDVNDRLIAERISTLLSHYWTADDPPELRRQQMGDWLDDLGEFGAATVAQAVEEWRRNETHRPSPAALRALCVRIETERRPQRAVPAPDGAGNRAAVDAAVRAREAQWAEAARARDAWAKAHGCSDFGEAMKTGLAEVARRVPK
jgi:hypothetical protein